MPSAQRGTARQRATRAVVSSWSYSRKVRLKADTTPTVHLTAFAKATASLAEAKRRRKADTTVVAAESVTRASVAQTLRARLRFPAARTRPVFRAVLGGRQHCMQRGRDDGDIFDRRRRLNEWRAVA